MVPGTPFQDWNFIDIRGQGVFVGDAWTVLNIQGSWWGEGDEKIYVDSAWDQGFPTHFGTGTEDYYGWAGGEVPTRQDEFSAPFLANARVGGWMGARPGFNICTRTRSLDAIPFTQRLVFDMESSFGTDIRNPVEPAGLLGGHVLVREARRLAQPPRAPGRGSPARSWRWPNSRQEPSAIHEAPAPARRRGRGGVHGSARVSHPARARAVRRVRWRRNRPPSRRSPARRGRASSLSFSSAFMR